MKKYIKRTLALFLIVCMSLGLIPAEILAATAEDPIVVIAGSDLQYENGQSESNPTTVQEILNKVTADYKDVDGFLFGGDYDAFTTNDKTETEKGINAIKNVVKESYSGLTDADMVLIQGNHDYASSMLAPTGENDPASGEYGVYVLNEDDYPAGGGSSSNVQALAADLEGYLDEKIENDYSKPIFVISHIPLHYTYRSYEAGDGLYAKYLVDVLNGAAEEGLNIIFMFAHNHSSDYDNYLGGGSVYLKKGDSIWVANPPKSTDKPVEYKLGFTYMNPGYVGFSNDDVDSTLTMTTFEITDTEVEVRRYSKNGIYNLKSAGKLTSKVAGYGYPAYTNVYTSPQTIELSILQTETVSNNGVTVKAPGITDLKVEKKPNSSNQYTAYALYDITPSGYTQGTKAVVTITVSPEDGFDAGRPVRVIDVENGTSQRTDIVNGKVTFTVNHFSEYAVVQSEDEMDWIEIPAGTVYNYTLATNGVTNGKEYLIVSGNSGTAYALKNNNDGETPGIYEIEIVGSTISVEDKTDIAWKFIADKDNWNVKNGTMYLEAEDDGVLDTTENPHGIGVSSGTNSGAYRVYNSDWPDYYIIWKDGGWTCAYNKSYDVYLYEEAGSNTSNGCYVALTGQSVFSANIGSMTEEAIMNMIRENITVYTASDDIGTNQTATADYGLSGTVNPAKVGSYPIAVTYAGKEIGTVNVHVNDVERVNVTLPELDSNRIRGGETKEVTVSADYTDVTYTWTSSNPNVATVSGNGATVTITAVGAGAATITVTATSATEGVLPGTATFEIVTIPENAPYVPSTSKTVYRPVDQVVDGGTYLLVNSGTEAYAVQDYKDAAGNMIKPYKVNILTDSEGQYIETTEDSIIWEAEEDTSGTDARGNILVDLKNKNTGNYLQAHGEFSDILTEVYNKKGNLETSEESKELLSGSLFAGGEKTDSEKTTGNSERKESTQGNKTTVITTTPMSGVYSNWRTDATGNILYSSDQYSESEETRYYVSYDAADNAFDVVTSNPYSKGNGVSIWGITTTESIGYYYYLDSTSGSVIEGAKSSAKTGANIIILYDDGRTDKIPVTVGMLSSGGNTVNTKEDGVKNGLTVSYSDKNLTFENFTLTVNERTGNDYPEYPDEGSVYVKKSADGVEFQSSGVAKVELSAMGVPVKKGTDFIIMIDASSSMDRTWESGMKKRSEVLEPALENLIADLKKPTEDGETLDIRIALGSFNGYYYEENNSRYSWDEDDLVDGAYKDNSATNTGGILTGDGSLSAEAFVPVTSLANDAFSGKIDYSTGTNYDYGFDAIYDLGAAIKAENEANGEERDLYVLFMSDGTPYQYNYFRAVGGAAAWENWLHGTIDQYAGGADAIYESAAANRNYYDASNGNKHRMAQAIKGDEDEQFVVIRKDANTDGTELNVDGTSTLPQYMTKLPGLGATVYSIGFLVDAGTELEPDTMEYVLKNVASSEECYFDIQSEEQLAEIFSHISTEITYAATNARFVDTMGTYYDLQIKPFDIKREDGSVAQGTPVITVQDYEIYTQADVDAGTVEADKIGDRKLDNKGNYISRVVETITFNNTGTEAYSNGDTSNNILIDGVIAAKSFWYNTTASAVMIDADHNSTTGVDGKEYSLAPETFYWNLGTISNVEHALSYYVYLTGSMEGKRPAGSYPTNESAVLYYENWLGHDAHKDTVSPVLPWESANVSYAFYLVNENGEIIANQTTGQTGSFANRIAVTNPVVFDDILLNNEDQVQSIEVASLGVLPDGYELYDKDAVYSIEINSNSTGSWEIVKGTNLVASTYVTGFRGRDYSNELVVNNNSYDYTHTTVWFAVVWKVQAVPDTVVIDYGLPVDIGVLVNDMFGDYATLSAVGALNAKPTGITQDLAGGFGTSVNGTYGVASVPEGSSEVRYTLNTSNGMQMKEKETFAYAVNYKGTTNPGYYYSDVTVIPASIVYYEDSFVTYAYNGTEETPGAAGSAWTTAGATIDGATQEEDRPGEYSLPVVDGNNLYGNDDAYKTSTEYSLGSAKKVNLSGTNYATAEFDFYGTGFDVVSLTSNKTGTITVQVYNESNACVKAYAVDTYYGYTRILNEETGEYDWVVTDSSVNNAIYQIPVIKVKDLPYGRYHAVITGAYVSAFDAAKVGSCDFYLDAIRIYDPAGVYAENNAANVDADIKNAYIADGEGWPEYHELRNLVLSATAIESSTDETPLEGIVFIDGVGNTSSVADYISYGPKNELYLSKNQSISFNMNFANAESVQLALKSLGGATEVTFANAANPSAAASITINTATDLYYNITSLNGKNAIITNTGDSILSITNVKVTYSEDPTLTPTPDQAEPAMASFMVTRSSVQMAVMALRSMGNTGSEDVEVIEPTPEVTPEPMPEPTPEPTPEQKVFTPKQFQLDLKNDVKAGAKFKVTVKTSSDVEYISIDGIELTKYSTDKRGETRTWTMELTAQNVGTMQIEVVAYNAEDVASETVAKTIEVKATAGKTTPGKAAAGKAK